MSILSEEQGGSTSFEKGANSIGNLVPQAFFDLIARIIPGPIILISFYIVFKDQINIDLQTISGIITQLSISTVTIFFSLFFLFYTLSVIFYGLWYLFMNKVIKWKKKMSEWEQRRRTRRITENQSDAAHDNDEANRYLEVTDAGIKFSLSQDFIKLKNTAAGNRMTKLKAEIHMSGALVINFILCSLLSLIFSCAKNDFWQAFVFFSLGVGAFYSNKHFNIRYNRSVESYASLLNFPYDRIWGVYTAYTDWRKK